MPSLASRAQARSSQFAGGRREYALSAYVSAVHFVAGRVAAVLGDGTVRFLNAGQPQVGTQTAHKGAILCCALCDKRNALLTGGDDGRVCRVTPEAVEVLAEGHKWIEAVAAPPGGGFAFAARHALIVRCSDGREIANDVPGPVGGAVPASATSLAIAHLGGVSLIDLSPKQRPARALKWNGMHVAVTVSPDGRFVVTGTYDGGLHGWRVGDGADMQMRGYVSKPRSLAWSADGQWLASSGARRVVLWPFNGPDGPMGKRGATLAPRDALVTNVVWDPKRAVVASGYEDGEVVFARHPGGRELCFREPDGNAITDMAFDEGGHFFACGTEKGDLVVSDLGGTA